MSEAPGSGEARADTTDPLVGRTIAGKFLVEHRLGAGAMGVVYRARQVALEKTVAIKVLHQQLANDPTLAERFAREAKAASRLDHPASIRVFDFGQEPDGLLYIAMEYVDGCDLLRLIDEHGVLAKARVVEILCQTLGALAMAHDMGVLHRDLKPENIMVLRGKSDEGRPIDLVKVCDFGIAKIMEASPGAPSDSGRKPSTAGFVVGTPQYMSPEQARGEKLDARSDLYSMGVILYELLTGRLPFEADTALGVVLKHLSEVPTPPSLVSPGLDPMLETICLKALSKSPSERYQDARQMRLALRGAAATGDGPVVPGSPDSAGSLPHAPLAIAETMAMEAPRATKATLEGMTPPTAPPKPKRSGAWLGGTLVVMLGVVWAYARSHRDVPASPTREAIALLESNTPPPPSAPEATIKVEDVPPRAAPSVAPAPSAPVTKLRRARTDHTPVAAPTNNSVNIVQATSFANELAEAPAALPSPPPPSSETPPPVAMTPVPGPPPPTPPPVAAQPRFDLTSARVEMGSAVNVIGTTALNVNRALSDAASLMTACYRSVLPRLTETIEGNAVLRIETDGAGVITDVLLRGRLGASMTPCAAAAVRGRRIPNVDTGSASADVPLVFKAR